MAETRDDRTSITVGRPMLAELKQAQAVMGAQAGHPITLGDCLRALLTTWRTANPHSARRAV